MDIDFGCTCCSRETTCCSAHSFPNTCFLIERGDLPEDMSLALLKFSEATLTTKSRTTKFGTNYCALNSDWSEPIVNKVPVKKARV